MVFDAIWPVEELESVGNCPYCESPDRNIAYKEVKDWAFGSAPGSWTYWSCNRCRALYLHPRPTVSSISNAYLQYYTHGGDRADGSVDALKKRMRNEYWSHALKTSIRPRLSVPSWGAWAINWLKPWIAEPFGLRQWAQRPRGLLIDVGCGNGDKLRLATQLGWQARGIELDGSAVKAALAQGLQVTQGSYELLGNYRGLADCVVCSHVLEHVHQPLQMLQLLLDSLKQQGLLLLSVPNANSFLRHHYGASWRGLEAPRHLAIPDVEWLTEYLQRQGFDCEQVPSHPLETAMESERMQRRADSLLSADVQAAKAVLRKLVSPSLARQDITQLVCVRAGV